MSKHAEFEATLRELPQIKLELLKQSKQSILQKLKAKNASNKTDPPEKPTQTELLGIEYDSDDDKEISNDKFKIAGALCVTDPTVGNNCEVYSKNAFNNLCLAEAITNGNEPRFVCDDDWVSTIGADPDEIKKFAGGYDLWKKTFLKSVKWLLQSQAAIKLKQNVGVPLGYRQASVEGDFLDTVYFKESAWNKAFSKLQPSTKISEQSLWLLAFLFHTERVKIYPADDGLQEICTFVGRSIEVRTDDALSSLKILAYNSQLLKTINIETFDDFANEELIAASMKYGNPQYVSRLLEKKPTLKYNQDAFMDGLFLAMHEDNQNLFDYLLTRTILARKTPDKMLTLVAMNTIKFKNNDAYFLKLLAASEKTFPDFINEVKTLDEYTNLVQNFERRLVLRNPFMNTLSLGEKADNEEFLKKVKRAYSKGVL
jgi:hypothetical protein